MKAIQLFEISSSLACTEVVKWHLANQPNSRCLSWAVKLCFSFTLQMLLSGPVRKARIYAPDFFALVMASSRQWPRQLYMEPQSASIVPWMESMTYVMFACSIFWILDWLHSFGRIVRVLDLPGQPLSVVFGLCLRSPSLVSGIEGTLLPWGQVGDINTTQKEQSFQCSGNATSSWQNRERLFSRRVLWIGHQWCSQSTSYQYRPILVTD
jgi:hypothetical protein